MEKRTYHLVQAVIKNVENKAFGFLESQNNLYWSKPQEFRPRPFPGARIAPKSDHIMALFTKGLSASNSGDQRAFLNNLSQDLVIIRYSIAATFKRHLSPFAVHL